MDERGRVCIIIDHYSHTCMYICCKHYIEIKMERLLKKKNEKLGLPKIAVNIL